MATSIASQDLEDLAADIGQAVYIDVAKWHLYLADAHLHTVLAERLADQLASGSITTAQVDQVLANIPVALGGGATEHAATGPTACSVSTCVDGHLRRLSTSPLVSVLDPKVNREPPPRVRPKTGLQIPWICPDICPNQRRSYGGGKRPNDSLHPLARNHPSHRWAVRADGGSHRS